MDQVTSVVPETAERKKKPGRKGQAKKTPKATAKKSPSGGTAKFPRHPVEKALRIPKAIIDQNAGKECTDKESAKYVGVGFNGPFGVEISSAIKYGFLTRPRPGVCGSDRQGPESNSPTKPRR
jgi:hypothetical protein